MKHQEIEDRFLALERRMGAVEGAVGEALGWNGKPTRDHVTSVATVADAAATAAEEATDLVRGAVDDLAGLRAEVAELRERVAAHE